MLMIRRTFLLVVLIAALAGVGTWFPVLPGAGHLAVDAAAQEAPVDLAWLAPGPDDLNGQGYGFTYGVYQTAASGGVSVTGNPWPLTEYDKAFAAGSPRQTYYQLLSQRSDDDPDIVARRFSIVLAEYGDEAAAKTGYAAVAHTFATYDQTRTPPEVGDEEIAFRGEFTSTIDGRLYQELRILVRTNRFLADLAIDDYQDDAPATSALTPVAKSLVERLKDIKAAGGPGFGLQVARIAGEDVTTFYDYYTRRHGDEVPAEGERSSQTQSDDEFHDATGMEDSYFYLADVLPTDQDPTFVSALVDFRHFSDDERAAAYLKSTAEDSTGAMGSGYADIKVVNDAKEFGDSSVAMSFIKDTRYGPATGYRIWVQLGDRVAAVELNGNPEISLSAAEDMAEAQLACLEDKGCGQPLAAADFMQAGPTASEEGTSVPEAGATPVDVENNQ